MPAAFKALPLPLRDWLKLLLGVFANPQFQDERLYDQRVFVRLCAQTLDEFESLWRDLDLELRVAS
jgi:hypothetical protein